MAHTSSTSGANAVVTITLTGVGSVRHVIRRVDAWTSAGTSQVTIQDGGTTVWLSPAAWVTTTGVTYEPTRSLIGAPGNTITISASAAGGGNTATLNVQHESVT